MTCIEGEEIAGMLGIISFDNKGISCILQAWQFIINYCKYCIIDIVAKSNKMSYNISMEKQFNIEYTPEALEDLKKLDKQNQKRAFRTIELFSVLGREGVTSRPLDKEGLFEMKCDKVRIYFTYQDNRLIIIGLITLKKTPKAPPHYKLQAHARINNYLNIRSTLNEDNN